MNATDGAMQKRRQDNLGGFFWGLNCLQLPHTLSFHVLTCAARDGPAAFRDQVNVSELLGEVLLLLAQKNSPITAVGQHTYDAAYVVNYIGPYALGGLVKNEHFRFDSRRTRNRQPLPLPDGKITAPAVQHLFQYREKFEQFRRNQRAGAFACEAYAQILLDCKPHKYFAALRSKPAPVRARSTVLQLA